MVVRHGAHDGAHGQAVEVVVNKNENAERKGRQLRADACFDVLLRPAAKRGRAACGVDKRDDNAEQHQKQEDAGIVRNGGHEALIDDGIQRSDRLEARGKERSDQHADKQRAVGLLCDQRQNNRNQRRHQRPDTDGKAFALCALHAGQNDQQEHERDHTYRYDRQLLFLLHFLSAPIF